MQKFMGMFQQMMKDPSMLMKMMMESSHNTTHQQPMQQYSAYNHNQFHDSRIKSPEPHYPRKPGNYSEVQNIPQKIN